MADLICPFISGLLTGTTQIIYLDCIEQKCRSWDYEFSECSIKVRMQVLKHYHQEHLHKTDHLCEDGFLMDCGTTGSSLVVLKAPILLAEFTGNEDLDSNGLIFGKDFVIDPTDPDIPPLLAKKQENIDCTGIPVVTWEAYLGSV